MTTPLARHASTVALAAVTTDLIYTIRYWLVGGRPHKARRYFPILALISVEVAAIVHLREVLRKLNQVVEAVEDQK